MLAYRVIARLDIKGGNLVKPVRFEGLRVLGSPAAFAKKYADEGADELLYLDIVASLYGRNQLESLIEETSKEVFIPITIAGGISDIGGTRRLLNAGADKIAINTAALKKNSNFLPSAAAKFGKQAITISIEAKRTAQGWQAYTDCGRIPSGKDAICWAKEAAALGAGEILVTSIDQDGTMKGPDRELVLALAEAQLPVPLVYGGGIAAAEDACFVARHTDGLVIGAALHYGRLTIAQVKQALRESGKEIR